MVYFKMTSVISEKSNSKQAITTQITSINALKEKQLSITACPVLIVPRD